MIHALVTQMLNALEHHQSQTRPIHKTEFAITAAREYLETALKPTLKEALTQQGINLRTEFEPKQRDHIEDSLGMVGERAELIARLAKQWAELDPVDPYRADIDQAVSMLEADAQQANKPTGWDNGLSQDYCKELGQWLASRPGARRQVKEMFEAYAQQAKQVPMNAVMQQALDTLQELWLLGDRAAAIANPAIESLKFTISQPPARPLENAEIDLLGVSGIEQFPALYNRVPWGGELMMYVRQLARAIEAHHGVTNEQK